MSCYVEYDRIRRGRKSIALCGDLVAEVDISGEPTCPECRRLLGVTSDEMFGTEPPGPPVRSTLSDPLIWYTPRIRKG